MIQYLRIPKNKFWGWVFSSLTIGLLLGIGAAWVIMQTRSAGEADQLKQQLALQSSQAASREAALQSRLNSAETSLSTVSQELQQLKADTEAANKDSADKDSASTEESKTVQLEVLSRKITPSTISTGDAITITARVQGDVDRVTVRVYSSGGSSFTYSLKKSSSDGDISTWKRTVNGPKKAGTYRYYATAYSGEKSATMPNASPSILKVE
jgi:hypothetical protein